MRNPHSLLISDTTLRDGEQMAGAALRPEQKLLLAQALAEAGVNSIEAGFPASNLSEVEAIRAITKEVRGPVIMALCRALATDIDAARAAFEHFNPFRCSVNIFLATSELHRRVKLRKSKQEILDMIASSIAYARKTFRLVSFSPEDASRTEAEFLCEAYRVAIGAGATSISFPDTVGILTPEKVRSFILYIQQNVSDLDRIPLAVHFHNDLGLGTANTLAAIQAGARIVQCTVNGLGERAGNTSLEEVALNLSLHQDQYQCHHTVKLDRLSVLSKLVAEATGMQVSSNKAIVGANVFTTAAGIHQDGIMKDANTYLPFSPALVGADGYRFVLSKHSGKAAVGLRLRELGYSFPNSVIELITKELESEVVVDDQTLLRLAVEQLHDTGALQADE